MKGKDELTENFKALYKKDAPMLIYYAAKFVDAETAEDLVQDVFLKVWDKWSFIFLKEGNVHTYLYNAVRHACLNHLKHLDVKSDYEENIKLQLHIEELYYTDDPVFLSTEDERLAAVYKEIDKLPEKCREIFLMAYIEEKKTVEIANLLNISKRTVEAQLYKALKNIREALHRK